MHVHWHEGLFLQPHHLQLMQHQLRMDIRAARALLTPFCFGVIESRLSHDDLADGRVRFERLRVIMPSGQEVFFPEDANLPTLDIRAELVRSAGLLEIMLAVPLWAKRRANAFRPGEPADLRSKLLFMPEEARDVPDENTGENPQSVHFRKVNARVVFKTDDLADMEFIPLLRVVRVTGQDTGKARQDPEFVAPCLLLCSSPVLHDMIRELVAQLSASREDFRLKAATGTHAVEVKWGLTMRLLVLNRFCAILPGVVEEGVLTPFALNQLLRELLGELLALDPARPGLECEPYNHLDPYRSFKELNLRIRELIVTGPGEGYKKLLFTGTAGKVRTVLEQADFESFEKATGYYPAVSESVTSK